MKSSAKKDNSNIGITMGMMSGVLIGIFINNVGLSMLIGFTLGLFYDRYVDKKSNI